MGRMCESVHALLLTTHVFLVVKAVLLVCGAYYFNQQFFDN